MFKNSQDSKINEDDELSRNIPVNLQGRQYLIDEINAGNIENNDIFGTLAQNGYKFLILSLFAINDITGRYTIHHNIK